MKPKNFLKSFLGEMLPARATNLSRRPNLLHRRSMLRGVLAGGASVAVGLPLLEIMMNSHGTALAGGGQFPVRLVTWFFGNGVNKRRWIPGGMNTPVTGPDWPVSEHLMPLAGVKNYVNIPTYFRNQCQNRITHHEGMTLFNGFTFNQQCQPGHNCQGFYSNAAGPTIDQIAAEYIAGMTPVKSIQLGVSKRQSGADTGTTMHNLSHRGFLQPLPAQTNPKLAFYTLFANVEPADDPSKPTRLAVLSAVREQAKRLEVRLGTRDRERLEAHLEGISELENKINTTQPVCAVPDEPTQENIDQDAVEPLMDVNRIMSDMLAIAFACDITRVASVLFHEGASDTVFPGGGSSGHHNNSHAFSVSDSGNESGSGLNGFNTGLMFTMTELGYLLNRLATTEDTPTTNLLDNSALLIGSDCMDGWSHDSDARQSVACLVAGRAGGRLKYPGVHIVQQGRNLSDIPLTVLNAVAPEVTSIGNVGQDNAASTTMISEFQAEDVL